MISFNTCHSVLLRKIICSGQLCRERVICCGRFREAIGCCHSYIKTFIVGYIFSLRTDVWWLMIAPKISLIYFENQLILLNRSIIAHIYFIRLLN